jgi:hypothetical protein
VSSTFAQTKISYSLTSLVVDVSTYGFYGLNQTESIFGNVSDYGKNPNIPSPSLNISAYYIDPGSIFTNARHGNMELGNVVTGTNWIDPRTGQQPFSDKQKETYTTANASQVLALGDSSTKGKCQPDGSYRWGFSFVLLFICQLLLLLWTTGTYTMWLKARLSMRHHRDNYIAGEYTALLGLAAALNHDFEKQGEDTNLLKERQIRIKIKKVLKGGSMMCHSPLRDNNYCFRDGVARWMKKNKWWLVALTLSSICAIVSGNAVWYTRYWRTLICTFTFSVIVAVGILMALPIGQTNRSRILITGF